MLVGRANMVAHKQLRFEVDRFDVELEEEDKSVCSTRPPRRFGIKITKDMEVMELSQFLNTRDDIQITA
ncbi:hypothetical protein C1646_755243 [Rhizophagus diaphanus]|nr:hypothetical protein C1646_755243 [Rhizophagus diaphanus] [Rhizophagus sp. MUCL 43196]